MKTKLLCLVAAMPLLAACGLTPSQKDQVAKFGQSTEAVFEQSESHLKQSRKNVVDLKRQSLEFDITAHPEAYSLDGGISSDAIAKRIAAMKALKDYGTILNQLATTDRTQDLKKSATSFVGSMNQVLSEPIDEERAGAFEGLVAAIGNRINESKKKKLVKEIVAAVNEKQEISYKVSVITKDDGDGAYKVEEKTVTETNSWIGVLAKQLKKDFTLIEASPCLLGAPDKFKKPSKGKVESGIMDQYCTAIGSSRDAAEYVLSNVLVCEKERREQAKKGKKKAKKKDHGYNCKESPIHQRDRALAINFKVRDELQNLREISAQMNKVVSSLEKSNKELVKVINNPKECKIIKDGVDEISGAKKEFDECRDLINGYVEEARSIINYIEVISG